MISQSDDIGFHCRLRCLLQRCHFIWGELLKEEVEKNKNSFSPDEVLLGYYDGEKRSHSSGYYQDSKLVINDFVQRLATIPPSSEVTMNCLCPGVVATSSHRHFPCQPSRLSGDVPFPVVDTWFTPPWLLVKIVKASICRRSCGGPWENHIGAEVFRLMGVSQTWNQDSLRWIEKSVGNSRNQITFNPVAMAANSSFGAL